MTDLHITWPEGEGRFSPADSPVAIGRASTAAVPLTEGSVSRQHLSVEWTGSQWSVSDNSTHGTFDTSGARMARQWLLTSEVALRLGGTEGVVVQITTVNDRQDLQDAATARAMPDQRSDRFGGQPGEQRGPALFPAESPAGGCGTPRPPEGFLQSEPDSGSSPFHFDRVPSPNFGDGFEEAATDSRAATPHGERIDRDSPPPAPRVRLETSARTGPDRLFDAAPAGGGPLGAEPPPDAAGPDFGPAPGAARNVGPNTTIISDSTLRLNVAGQDYSFLPGAEVTVGRDPACLVQLDEQHSLVSRRHLRITFNDGNWWLEDFSSKGTFIDHRQITGPYKAEGAFIANLGDDDAGTAMRIITAGEHRVPKNRTMLILGALAFVGLLALGALAISLANRGSDTVAPDLEGAKKSTVVLFGLEGGQGSGFFVSDNLILTNQHVAVLSPQMLVGVSRELDAPAQIEYATELVANHPFLDISVLRVSNRATITADGPNISAGPVGEIGLPAVTIGDSEDITIGDAVYSTGFPGRLTITSTDESGALRLPSVVLTNGEAANFTIWPGCSNPEFAAFIPADSPPGVACSGEGDIERGVLLSSFSSGQGASGSAVFRNDEVVAVVYAGAANEDNASLNITTAAFASWLEEIIRNNP
ncbi:MAG: FHA domain-containing protein [Actinomycetota bacterium]